jgi:hypothetical protein
VLAMPRYKSVRGDDGVGETVLREKYEPRRDDFFVCGLFNDGVST